MAKFAHQVCAECINGGMLKVTGAEQMKSQREALQRAEILLR